MSTSYGCEVFTIDSQIVFSPPLNMKVTDTMVASVDSNSHSVNTD